MRNLVAVTVAQGVAIIGAPAIPLTAPTGVDPTRWPRSGFVRVSAQESRGPAAGPSVLTGPCPGTFAFGTASGLSLGTWLPIPLDAEGALSFTPANGPALDNLAGWVRTAVAITVEFAL